MYEVTCDFDALVLALKLAITADTDEKAATCVVLAEQIAARMPPNQIEEAKLSAQKEKEES